MKRTILLLLGVASLLVLVSCKEDYQTTMNASTFIGDAFSQQSDKQVSSITSDIDFNKLVTDVKKTTQKIGTMRKESTAKSIYDDTSWLQSVIVKMEGESQELKEVVFTAKENMKYEGQSVPAGTNVPQGKITGSVDKIYAYSNAKGDSYTFISYLLADTDAIISSMQDSNFVENAKEVVYEIPSTIDGHSTHTSYKFYRYNQNPYPIAMSTYYPTNVNGRYITANEQGHFHYRCEANTDWATEEKEGVSEYDTYGYISDVFRKSYCLDNTTGLIYQVPEGLNLFFVNGMAFDMDLGPLDLSIQNEELIVKQICPYKDIHIFSFMVDKYGQYYIGNNEFALHDDNVLYFQTFREYLLTEDGTAIHFTYNPNNLDDVSFAVVGPDYEEKDVRDLASVDYTFRNNTTVATRILEMNAVRTGESFYDFTYAGKEYTHNLLGLHKEGEKTMLYRSSDTNATKLCVETKETIARAQFQQSTYLLTSFIFSMLDERYAYFNLNSTSFAGNYIVDVFPPGESKNFFFNEDTIQKEPERFKILSIFALPMNRMNLHYTYQWTKHCIREGFNTKYASDNIYYNNNLPYLLKKTESGWDFVHYDHTSLIQTIN